jgi:TRAP-type C4-dicarboxylate transport system substrate-binding protein
MKKRLISLGLVASLVLAMLVPLSSCSSSSDNSSSGGSGSSGSSGSDDKVYELIVTNHDAVTSVGEQYVETVLGQIEEESGGRLKFVFNAGGSLFSGGEAVDAVRSGAADICWNATSITVGVFPISEFLNVPLNGITCARIGSKVLRDMYKEIPECAAEYDDFYVLSLQGNCAAPLSTVNTKIESPDDFKGLSIRAAGTVQSKYIEMLGASPSSMSTSEVYEALEKNVVSGMTNDWHNIDCFNLYEVVNYVMNYTVNTTSCFMLMNKDKYESLPEDLQALLDKYNDYASDMAGWYWDCMYTITGEKMTELGVEIYEPNDEVLAYMQSDELKQAMEDWYIEYLNGFGYDGQAIWDKCMEIVARYADDYQNPYAEPMSLDDWDMTSVDNY